MQISPGQIRIPQCSGRMNVDYWICKRFQSHNSLWIITLYFWEFRRKIYRSYLVMTWALMNKIMVLKLNYVELFLYLLPWPSIPKVVIWSRQVAAFISSCLSFSICLCHPHLSHVQLHLILPLLCDLTLGLLPTGPMFQIRLIISS